MSMPTLTASTARRTVLAEASTPLTRDATKPLRYRARLIAGDVLGSCAYYPREVLERDGPLVFPAGTPCYLNHPSLTEQADRPERSVRDLAARIVSAPTYDGDGLYADVQVYPHMAPVIEGLANDVGLSIRAEGLVEMRDMDGQEVPVLTEFTRGYSVDFVTTAGAGGKLTALLESARADRPPAAVELAESGSIGAWVESRLHLALTSIGDDMYGSGRLTRDERIALSSAVGDALDAFTGTLESAAPQLYTRDQWGYEPTEPPAPPDVAAPGYDMAEAGRLPVLPTATTTPRRPDRAQLREAIRVAAVRDLPPSKIRHLSRAELARLGETTDPPAGTPPAPSPEAPEGDPGPAGTPPPGITPESTEDPVTTPTGATPDPAATTPVVDPPPPATTVTEAAATALAEARAETAQAKAGQAAAVRALAERDARDAARVAATAALAESPLPAPARQAVIERVTATAVLTEAGTLDEVALAESIQAAAAREATYLAALAESGGAGTPSGLGASARPPAPEGSIADLDRQLNEAFRGIGLSEEAALVATKGR